MNDNDFSEVLANFINTLGLPLKCKLDYLSENESLSVYPLPGGKVEDEDMAGTQILSLPYEIAIKSKVRKTCLKDLPWNSLKKNG